MPFIGVQLRDFIERAEFTPFEITLLNRVTLQVGYPEAVTLLSGGFLFHEQDATHRIVSFEAVLALQTLFNPFAAPPGDGSSGNE